MSVSVLFFVAFGATMGLLILLSYAPIHTRFLGKSISPRLIFAHLIAPADIGITLILIFGTIVGLTAVTGIGNIVFNVATGLGLSGGAFITRKFMMPRWRRKFEEEKATLKSKKRIRLFSKA